MQESVIANGKSRKTKVVFQPSRLIDVAANVDFSLGTAYFFVKIKGTDPITQTVIYADDGVEISTTFSPGWNPDAIRFIKSNQSTNIQIGF